MHKWVHFNNQILPQTDASVSAMSSAALYGKGIFTTVPVFDVKPFLWEKHWRRLNGNAELLGIDLAEFSENVNDAISTLILRNDLSNGRLRITFFDDSSSDIWPSESNRKTSLLITTAVFRHVPAGLRLTISPHRINSASPLAGIKSCNYLEKLLALDEARQHGFDEAIRLNESGEIASGCMANVFWLKGGRLFTPSLKTGCLAGTTREFVLENCVCNEVETGIDALQNVDSIFLTSAGIGVAQVSEFDGRTLPCGTHEILQLIPKTS